MTIYLFAPETTDDEPDWAAFAEEHGLTPRETQVLAGIWHGEKYLAIGFQMGITKYGVDAHWREIKAKLKVRNHKEAIRMVAQAEAEGRLRAMLALYLPKMLPPAGGNEPPAAMTGCPQP